MNVEPAVPVEAAVAVVLGAAIAAAGLAVFIHNRALADRSRETTGAVEEVETWARKGGRSYWATVRFRTDDGRDVAMKMLSLQPVETGGTVGVVYDPDRIDAARIGTVEEIVRSGRGCLLVGFLVGSAVCLAGLMLWSG
jgi:hypothetical protein